MPPLKNSKHEAYAQGLAKQLSADEAYEAAGYKPNRGNATRLKANESIQARFDELMKAGAKQAEIDIARVLKELARIGTSDIRDLFNEDGSLKPIHQLGDDVAAAVASVEVVTKAGPADDDGNRPVELVHKIKFWDKNSGLEKLGKHFKMFTEKHEHSGPNGSPIQTEEVSARESIASQLARLAAAGSPTGDTEEPE